MQFFYEQKNSNQTFVFHCEFSSVRALRVAARFREIDAVVLAQKKKSNLGDPRSYRFNQVYILAGGYCVFFRNQKR